MNNEFLIVTPHGPCMHHELSYYFICSRFVSLFGISIDGEAKSKYICAGAILFLEIQ